MNATPDGRNIFIQARMDSSRFPGKVLAPLAGRPVIHHLIDRLSSTWPLERIVVATSEEQSDDPLVDFLDRLGVLTFRGSLDNVVLRFQRCLERHPCQSFVRVSGDSPFLDPAVVRRVVRRARDGVDLVTNIFPRSFPKGFSVEVISASAFRVLDSSRLSPEHTEHVTRIFYDQADRYRIVNVHSGNARLAKIDLTVDTVEDLRRLETLLLHGLPPTLTTLRASRK